MVLLGMQHSQIPKVYEEYLPNVYRYSFSKLGNKADAEDIVSEVFLSLVQNYSKVDNPHAWLIGAARNLIYRKFRDKPQIEPLDAEEQTVSDSTPVENAVIDEALLEQVKSELNKLDEVTKEIIILKIWEDMKFTEIAELLETTESTVKAKYYRGLEQMAKKQTKMRVLTIPLLLLAIPQIVSAPEFVPSSTLVSSVEQSINFQPSTTMWQKMISKFKSLPVAVKVLLLALPILAIVSILFFLTYGKPGTPTETIPEQSSSTESTTTTPETRVIETDQAIWYLDIKEEVRPTLMTLIDQYFPFQMEYCKTGQDCYITVNGVTKPDYQIYTKSFAATTKYYLVGQMKTIYPGKNVYLALSSEMPYGDVVKGLPTEADIKLGVTFATLFIDLGDNKYVLGRDYDNVNILRQEPRILSYTAPDSFISEVKSMPEVGITFDAALDLDIVDSIHNREIDYKGKKLIVNSTVGRELFTSDSLAELYLLDTLGSGSQFYSNRDPKSSKLSVVDAVDSKISIRTVAGLRSELGKSGFNQPFVYYEDTAKEAYYSYTSRDLVWTASKVLEDFPDVADAGYQLFNTNTIQYIGDPIGCNFLNTQGMGLGGIVTPNSKLLIDISEELKQAKLDLGSGVQLAATTDQGDEIYIVTDKSWPLFKIFYDNRKIVTKSVAAVDYETYLQYEPVLLWKDTLGIWRAVFREDMVSPTCYAEPVIYLYPTTPTEVSVSLPRDLDIVRVEPKYSGVWNVLANPNGTLIDLITQKKHKYLFWEANAPLPTSPVIQQVVAKQDMSNYLTQTLNRLGLNATESADFMKYWLPQLQEASFYVMQFFDAQSIDKVIPLAVSPTPETAIRVLLNPIPVSSLPDMVQWGSDYQAPERIGFTLVEWGGIVKGMILE